MTEPVIVPRAEHRFRGGTSIQTRSKSSIASTNQAPSRTSSAAACAICSSAAAQRLRHRHVAHPYQVKKLFRNCWIIGRRFRLAHVRFGVKTIEVATFRKIVPAGSESNPPSLAKAGRASA